MLHLFIYLQMIQYSSRCLVIPFMLLVLVPIILQAGINMITSLKNKINGNSLPVNRSYKEKEPWLLQSRMLPRNYPFQPIPQFHSKHTFHLHCCLAFQSFLHQTCS